MRGSLNRQPVATVGAAWVVVSVVPGWVVMVMPFWSCWVVLAGLKEVADGGERLG
jgi:hypothetical protein